MRLGQLVNKFYQVEKVTTGKLFLKYLRVRNREREQDCIIAYAYIRWLDDLVDSGIDPGNALRVLEQEEKVLAGIPQGEKFATESYPFLIQIHQRYGTRMLELFKTFIVGFRVDNSIIMTGEPLAKQHFGQRTVIHTLTCFQVVSLIAHDKEFAFGDDYAKLMQAWSNYDSLIDIKEDLNAGLILFTREDLDAEGITLKRGAEVPAAFRGVYDRAKRRTVRDLLAYSSSVERTNLPFWERFSLHAYFLSRVMKLLVSQYPLTEPGFIVGNTNL